MARASTCTTRLRDGKDKGLLRRSEEPISRAPVLAATFLLSFSLRSRRPVNMVDPQLQMRKSVNRLTSVYYLLKSRLSLSRRCFKVTDKNLFSIENGSI